MSVYGRGFLLNERTYSNKALRRMTTLLGEKRLCLSFYNVSVYGMGLLLNERIYSNKRLRRMATLSWGRGGGES